MPVAWERIIGFDEVDDTLGDPGIYEIWVRGGDALKVGIASKLRRRLKSHAASRQSGLWLKPGGHRKNPADVYSKSSILAKHLYYDRDLTREYNLTLESGRRRFLLERCEVRFRIMPIDAARELECELEDTQNYRYRGRVIVRP